MTTSTSTVFIFAPASGTPSPQATAPSEVIDPPIVDLFRIVVRAYSLVARILGDPLDLFYASLAYLLSPLSVLWGILVDLFVRTPYALVGSVAHHIYPFYVFFGICLIFAFSIGIGSRICAEVVKMIIKYFWPSPQHSTEPPAKVPVSPLHRTSPLPRMGGRRVVVKDEKKYR